MPSFEDLVGHNIWLIASNKKKPLEKKMEIPKQILNMKCGSTYRRSPCIWGLRATTPGISIIGFGLHEHKRHKRLKSNNHRRHIFILISQLTFPLHPHAYIHYTSENGQHTNHKKTYPSSTLSQGKGFSLSTCKKLNCNLALLF